MEDTRTEAQKKIDEQQMNDAYAEIAKAEKEDNEYNDKLLKEIGASWKDFKSLLDGSYHYGKIEIVNNPNGTDQDEKVGIFKQIFVDQWTTGTEGDSFAGYIYARFDKNKWLKIRYEC